MNQVKNECPEPPSPFPFLLADGGFESDSAMLLDSVQGSPIRTLSEGQRRVYKERDFPRFCPKSPVRNSCPRFSRS
uniref:Uncharacterized protein n=1 Tax=Anguilla anguilla TaxID=7936 RepID=A0A0E9Q3J6_ANGAN